LRIKNIYIIKKYFKYLKKYGTHRNTERNSRSSFLTSSIQYQLKVKWWKNGFVTFWYFNTDILISITW